MGTAPLSIMPAMADLCAFLGSIIFSPGLQAAMIMACTPEVVPFTRKKAFSAP